METEPIKKGVKIDTPIHEILKKYCDKRGLKIQKFLEMLIVNNCSE